MYAILPTWEPSVDCECLDVVPSIRLPIGLARASDPEPQDTKALED
jgi:hypothetical protein